MSAPLVFMDCETTGLSLADDIWEFAAIRREPDGTETKLHLFIEHDPDKCRALPEPFLADHRGRYYKWWQAAVSRKRAAAEIELFTRRDGDVKPHIVGAVPNFDTERVALLLRDQGYEPGWHYHLIDVENLAVGYLRGRLSEAQARGGDGFVSNPSYDVRPPWNSDELANALGVTITETERHTAMGDARWAMRIYDAVMGETLR